MSSSSVVYSSCSHLWPRPRPYSPTLVCETDILVSRGELSFARLFDSLIACSGIRPRSCTNISPSNSIEPPHYSRLHPRSRSSFISLAVIVLSLLSRLMLLYKLPQSSHDLVRALKTLQHLELQLTGDQDVKNVSARSQQACGLHLYTKNGSVSGCVYRVLSLRHRPLVWRFVYRNRYFTM